MDTQITTHTRRETLIAKYRHVRGDTERLCSPLVVDDYQIQSIVQTSPPKWHIAHVTWFFEAFVLPQFNRRYQPFHTDYDYLFNSYYYTYGQMHPRSHRGLLSRPSVEEVYRYRRYVDEAMIALMTHIESSQWDMLAHRIILGLNHEEQHQELLLMDIKHNFSVNPLLPAYRENPRPTNGQGREMRWHERIGGIKQIGSDGDSFAYDNETPRHKVLLQDHRLADRFVTNGEYLAFIEDGGYQQPALWLSDGWALLAQKGWCHPLYWRQDDHWKTFTLGGERTLNPNEPVCHISFYEADAYARWAGKRLPLESELESQLSELPLRGHFADQELFHPKPAGDEAQWYGDLWAWTASAYSPYPGFRPLEGSMGEYNGKFMSNQMVLKGGCCATPAGHTRASYRNFFYPDERWAFTGLRLAEDG
jgi:ergothioneine biosynthesis protein EgtB